jgi:hypothetical protein
MFNKFQTLISSILENSCATAFGTPAVGSEISNPTSINPDKGFTDNIKGAMATALPNKMSKKKKKKKFFPKVIRRPKISM